MILIIGGLGQGKREYVRRKYYISHNEMSKELNGQKVIYGLHDIIREEVLKGANPKDGIIEYAQLYPDTIFICDEVGCGVVPIDAGERQWRECVGRICTELAERAETVTRIFCGLPMTIKPK